MENTGYPKTVSITKCDTAHRGDSPGNFLLNMAGMRQRTFSRRKMVKTLPLVAAAAAWAARQVLGAALDNLDVTEPKAAALGYVENAAQVDAKKYPSYVRGSNCENCLQLQGTAGNSYRPCALFKGKLVSVSGWCSAWTAEM
jgi:hypothetical protein